MKFLIDANVIVDVLERREPYWSDSLFVWHLCETGETEGILSAITVANILYVLRKKMTPDTVEQTVSALFRIFRIEDLCASDIEGASALRWKDFEDALQYVTAEKARADAIITRNVRDFAGSEIPVMTPSECRETFTEKGNL